MTMSNALWKLIQRFLDDKNGMPVLNPATGEQIAAVKTYSTAEIEDIILRADNARKDWAALTAKVRAERLRDWYFQVMAYRDQLASLCTAECGKPLAESLAEVVYAASFIEWFAEEVKRAYGETIPTVARGKAGCRHLRRNNPLELPTSYDYAQGWPRFGGRLRHGCETFRSDAIISTCPRGVGRSGTHTSGHFQGGAIARARASR